MSQLPKCMHDKYCQKSRKLSDQIQSMDKCLDDRNMSLIDSIVAVQFLDVLIGPPKGNLIVGFDWRLPCHHVTNFHDRLPLGRHQP